MRTPERVQRVSDAASRRRLSIDAAGYATSARQVRSPNCDARPPGTTIDVIVVHGISLPPGEFGGNGIKELFTNRLDPDDHPYYASIARLRVSSHFLVRRDGELVQFVSCDQRAWHAGLSSWNGRKQCNDFSIGVELEGVDDIPYTAAQYTRLARLARALRRHYPITDIVGHSDIAPGRKTDPGPAFDWSRLMRLVMPRAP
jgi:N-acetyl-anhydromuramoyl-L-alanine amidase